MDNGKVWSDDQNNFYAWNSNQFVRPMGRPLAKQNGVLVAVAGSGKTTTLLHAATTCVPQDARVLEVAFNTDIANVMRNKLGGMPGHTVNTYHQYGLSGIRRAGIQFRIDNEGKKVDNILRAFLDRWNWKHIYPVIKRMVGLVKNNLIDDLSDQSLFDLADEYSLEVMDDSDVIFNAVRRVIRESRDMTSLIDFDDMIWLPYALGLQSSLPTFDMVYVDEVQDTNQAQSWLISQSLGKDGVIVGVGDPAQSIYVFRGAASDAMDKFTATFNAVTMPLSITYRCSQAVVEYVNMRFPEINFKAYEKALPGNVERLPLDKVEFGIGDMVLCRNNAPLVPVAFNLIGKGIPAKIRGRDIGSNLISLVNRMQADEMGDLMERLNDYRASEVYKLTRADKPGAAANVEDKVNTIVAVADKCTSVDELKSKLNDLFTKDVTPVVLSTVHKAKGLEASNVFIINPELLESGRSRNPVDLQQERNIHYVAATRAKDKLTFVTGGAA